MKLFDVILFICLIFLTTLYWSEWIIYPLILTLFVVSLIAYSRRMKGNAFHPLAYVIYIFFTLLVIPLFIVPLTVYDQSLLQEIPKVSMLIGLATISVYIGYYMRAGRNIATFIPLVGFPHVRLQRAIIQRIVILYLIGWIGRAALMVVGYSHISSQITKLLSYLSLLKDLSNFSILCFTMLIYYIFTSISKRQMSRSVGYTYIVGLSILEITYGVMYGGRSAIIMPFLMILFSYSFSVKRIRWSVIVTLFLSAMLIAGPIITAYRVSFFDALLDTSNVSRSAVVMAALDKTKIQNINWVEASMEVFQHRTGTVETTMRMMNRVPSKHDYEMGNTFIPELSTAFIPRIFWPETPIYNNGRYYSYLFWDDSVHYSETGSSTGIGIFGELYFNFGWLGLIFMPFFGLVIRIIMERIKLYSSTEIVYGNIARYYYLIFVVSSGLTATIAGFIVTGIRAWIIYLIFLTLLHMKLPKIFQFRATRTEK